MMSTKPRRATVLSIIMLSFFLSQLLACYISHSLTLLMNSYQTFFNLLSLILIVISQRIASKETSLRNTFGWARTEVVGTLVAVLFLFALCFAITTTSIQTLVHAGHEETAPHYPMVMMVFGIVGLTLDVFCYLITGDPNNSRHPGTSLTVRGNKVQVNFVESGSTYGIEYCGSPSRERKRHLSEGDDDESKFPDQKQPSLFLEALRTSGSCVTVLICATVVHFGEGHWIADYIDPVLALVAVAIIVFTFYPYVRNSGLILLQTIPEDVNIEKLQRRILQKFPELINLHDLHIWALNDEHCIATVHITLEKCEQNEYEQLTADIEEFFINNGINSVTIQPEFCEKELLGDVKCALKCQACTQHNCVIGQGFEKNSEVFATRRRVGSQGSFIISPKSSCVEISK